MKKQAREQERQLRLSRETLLILETLNRAEALRVGAGFFPTTTTSWRVACGGC